MDKLLIRGGMIIDPASNRAEIADLYIENGIIKVTVPVVNPLDVRVIDARGMWVVPGLIDLHVHFRDPGQTHKEDIETGLRAAARGGFTTVCTMANTLPVVDNPKLIKYQLEKTQDIKLGRLLPVSAATKGLEGRELVDLRANKAAGAVAFSDDGKFISDTKILCELFKEAAKNDVPVFSHCEDYSESECVGRDIVHAVKNKARLHICHISTAKSVEALREGRRTHANQISAEVTPHHFTLTNVDLKNSNGKMSPPLRSAYDREAVLKALSDEVISVIATDHAPHSAEEKAQSFEMAPNGIIGLETAVALAITELYHTKLLTEKQLIACLTCNPAKVIGKNELGTLQAGKTADITIIDPNHEWVVDSKVFASKSKNTPFDGRCVKGRVTTTICGGRIIYSL